MEFNSAFKGLSRKNIGRGICIPVLHPPPPRRYAGNLTDIICNFLLLIPFACAGVHECQFNQLPIADLMFTIDNV
jgi:hypothetical protein